MNRSTQWITLLLTVIVSACSPDEAEIDAWAAEPSPALGKSDGMDSKDKSCMVVLRDAQKSNVSGDSNKSIRGQFDVFKPMLNRKGLEARVLYSFNPNDGFFSVRAQPISGGGNGYQRFHFEIYNPSSSDSSHSNDQGEEVVLIPYLRQGTARLFDQNTAGKKAKLYKLSSPQYAYQTESKVCPVFKKEVPDWVGDIRIGKTQSQFDPCDNAIPLERAFAIEEDLSGLLDMKYHLCFRIQKHGVTDEWPEEEKIRLFDTGIESRFSKNGDSSYVHGIFNKQIGDSFQYSVNLSSLKPFDDNGCPQPGIPIQFQQGDPLAWIKANFTIHVNEQEIGAGAGHQDFEVYFGIDPMKKCQ